MDPVKYSFRDITRIIFIIIFSFVCRINLDGQLTPVFSQAHGFFDSPFLLTISSSDPAVQIYFTTDGSVPGTANGSLYTAPLNISTSTILRAVCLKNNLPAGSVNTSTYLFAEDVIHQSNTPPGYPSVWGPYTGITGTAIADYEMDPEMMADPQFASSVKDALLDIPTISIVTDKGNFFNNSKDPATGGIYIYTGPPLTNTTNGLGFGWERPASFEFFDSHDSVSLQVNCGVRIQGGHSRRPEKNPKHSLRLVFRSEYGPSKLKFPLFGKDALEEYNTIILRASFGNTWVHWSRSERSMAQYLRDRWSKDTHRAMGHFSSHGFYVHLYINGLYWGLYNPSERLDSDFAASYLGGDATDYDVIKDFTEIVDGNLSAWNGMMAMANSGLSSNDMYQSFIGNNPDGTINPDIEPMVDVVSLADYMLLNFYGGNWDWDHHNWVAIRNRLNPGKGFQFFCWDEEHMAETVDANILNENNSNCPSRIFQQLRKNDEFRRLFADRVQKFCFGGGALTPSSAAGRWQSRSEEIDKAVIAESARWGDYRRDVHSWQTGPYDLYTKEAYWLPQNAFMMGTYFPGRTDVFVEQLRIAGLFPSVDAPSFRINNLPVSGTIIKPGDVLSMSVAEGEIYYTTDGSDPVIWQPEVKVSGKAVRYTGQLTLTESGHFKARTCQNGAWSAVNERFFLVPVNISDIKITEIQYHPSVQNAVDNSEFEFIEIKNTGTSTLDIGGFRFIDGIKFEFPPETQLGPHEFIVLASDRKHFYSRYGFLPFARYDGRLDNSGEKVTLVTAEFDTVCSFAYSSGYGWPEEADGSGKSLVPLELNPANDQNSALFWRPSYYSGGSPGADDLVHPEGDIRPEIVTLFQNYPNPFSGSTNILYFVNSDAWIGLSVYNVLGQRIITIKDAPDQSGFHNILWDGNDQNGERVANGIYFLKIDAKAGNEKSSMTRKMIFTGQ